MLVLSRRPDEKILLPSIPAVIKVISAQPGVVRLGIEAPPHVPIIREELAGRQHARHAADPVTQESRHAVRNRLHNLGLAVALLRLQMGEDEAVRETLDGMETELEALRLTLTSSDAPEQADKARAVQPTA
jgi:carbon storage regulator CsrA